MIHINGFPKDIGSFRPVINFFQNFNKPAAEGLVPKGMPQHIPSVASTHLHAVDISVCAFCHAPFFRFTLGINRSIVRVIDFFFKGILGKIVVRRANVCVAQVFLYHIDAGIVVSGKIVIVFNDLNSKLILQILKLLFHVSNHHNDLSNASFLKLADLALDQHLAFHFDQRLGTFIGQRRKPAGCARSHDHRVIDRITHFQAPSNPLLHISAWFQIIKLSILLISTKIKLFQSNAMPAESTLPLA